MSHSTMITGTGTVLPELLIPNTHFEASEFYDRRGTRIEKSGVEIVAKLESITGIKERR